MNSLVLALMAEGDGSESDEGKTGVCLYVCFIFGVCLLVCLQFKWRCSARMYSSDQYL